MQKKHIMMSLGVLSLISASVALSLHFYSLKTELQEVEDSYSKLSEKYNSVLSKNEDLNQKVNGLEQDMSEKES